MATQGRELLGEYYDRDHLTYDEVRELGLRAVTEDGDPVSQEEFQGKVFRFANRDDASGYVVRSMEETGAGSTLAYLQRA